MSEKSFSKSGTDSERQHATGRHRNIAVAPLLAKNPPTHTEPLFPPESKVPRLLTGGKDVGQGIESY
jgi:hypothetical protein